MNLIAVAVFSMLAVTVYRITRSQVKGGVYHMRLAQAHGIAEAGLEDALHELYGDPGWRAGFRSKSFAGGSYTVTVSTEDPPWVYSTGYSKPIVFLGPAVKTVSAKAKILWSNEASCAIRAGKRLAMDGLVNAYDSATNPDPLLFGFGANVCSNGTLEVLAGIIRGNATYFSGSPPVVDLVEGEIIRSTTTTPLTLRDGSAHADSNDNLTGLTPLSVYNSATKDVRVPLLQTATLSPGVYYFNSLVVDGTLVADTASGAVTIYLTGDLNSAASTVTGGIVNNGKIPSLLSIYGQGRQNIYLKSATALHAVVETPQGQLTVSQVMYGKAAADVVNLTGVFHFDEQLGGKGSPSSVAWKMGTWSASYARQ
jgi:hypothetical protein